MQSQLSIGRNTRQNRAFIERMSIFSLSNEHFQGDSLSHIQQFLPIGDGFDELFNSFDDQGLTPHANTKTQCRQSAKNPGGDKSKKYSRRNEEGASNFEPRETVGIRAWRRKSTNERSKLTILMLSNSKSLLGESLNCIRKSSQAIFRQLGHL